MFIGSSLQRMAMCAFAFLVAPLAVFADESDYNALLSIASYGQVSAMSLPASPAAKAGPTKKTWKTADAVIFLKMIKVGGELFSIVLSQYGYKKGWRALQHKNCLETANNTLGLATCACNEHYIDFANGDLPAKPTQQSRYSVAFTHMHYDPVTLQSFMYPGAVKLTILRSPLSVLRSIHRHAASQAVHEPWIKDSFCQQYALDGDQWREKCPKVSNGEDSILDYLDPPANAELMKLFRDRPKDLHAKALAIVQKVVKRLEDDFYVGLQEDYDASMLLFERVLGWSRSDSLYPKGADYAHVYKPEPAVDVAMASWHTGTPEGQRIIDKLNEGPLYYYTLVYEKGVAIHQKQMREVLGEKSEVEPAVLTYRKQLDAYTTCLKNISSPANPCNPRGLRQQVKWRPECARVAGAA